MKTLILTLAGILVLGATSLLADEGKVTTDQKKNTPTNSTVDIKTDAKNKNIAPIENNDSAIEGIDISAQ